jgi:RNA polymerase sigma-70 factor (ECF subfamily)
MDAAPDRSPVAAASERHRAELRAYLTRLVVRPEVAEELVQEAFLRMITAGRVPDEPGEARAWLFAVATNLAIDHLRRHSTWREDALPETKERCSRDRAFVDESRSLRGTPEQQAIAREHLAICFACTLRNLAPFESASLLLKEVYDFSTAEVASMLGATPIQVKNWLQRARRTLEARYAETCALVTQRGVCHQCVELDRFFNGKARDPLAGSARDVEARLAVLRADRDASLGRWHRAMLRVLDDLLAGR